ncbi:MAG TPA: XdhC family protein [Chitinophagales bacterium]|nr:XdhC family protein [Chitinophagales bacterium]
MNNNAKFYPGSFPWQSLTQSIEAGERIALLYVVHSTGSSPGRQGFTMMVHENGEMQGSIGGGFMEQKLVDLALSKIKSVSMQPFIKRQIHSKEAVTDQSGMICSGEQTVAFYFPDKVDLNVLNQVNACLRNSSTGKLTMDESGIRFEENILMESQYKLELKNNHQWKFEVQIGFNHMLYIVGGGHVGLALSEIMSRLGFHIVLLDDREGLNTMEVNSFANMKSVVEYKDIANSIPESVNTYVVLVSFGYRTDKVILKQLLGKNYRYIGMLGSEAKVKQLFKELVDEGVKENWLKQVHAPIGIPIQSKTPYEIAVSIAAEIISVKNSSPGHSA